MLSQNQTRSFFTGNARQTAASEMRNPTLAAAAAKLKIAVNWKYLVAFFALAICAGELHEQVHIQTGRVICGDYGERDFNVWALAQPCRAPQFKFLATLAGPLWSFALMWTGAFLLLKAKKANFQALGFSLVFAPLPLARIFTAVMGGGDEKVVLRALLENDLSQGAIKILAVIIVTLACLAPILIAYRQITNRRAIFYVAGFLILPLVILSVYIFQFLNPLLTNGFLAAPVLGTPLLVLFHFLLMTLLLFFSRKWLLTISSRLS